MIPESGFLVTLEGLDGAGKTTLWNALQEEFPDAYFTREPTRDTWYGDAVYQSLTDGDADPLAELHLYLADHANHIRSEVYPELEDGRLVICDRYMDSRCAYQAASLEDVVPVDDIVDWVWSHHTDITRVPDTTVFLELTPEQAVARSEAANKFERQQYLTTVEEKYNSLIERDSDGRFATVDARADPDDVVAEVVEVIESRWDG